MMYARKLRERQEKGFGWPGCHAFENEGCKLCATCMHKGKIKSPLNLAPRAVLPPPDSPNVQVKEEKVLSVEANLTLYKRGADRETLFAALNETYAVVRYGGEVTIACIIGQDIFFMKAEDFHKMYGNIRFQGRKTVYRSEPTLVSVGGSTPVSRSRRRIRAGWPT